MKILQWFPKGIFGRTFVLLALLMAFSLAAWFQTFLLLERQPRAVRLAQEIAALVNLTSASLEHTSPENKDELLEDLKSKEGIVIYPRTVNDAVEPLPDSKVYEAIIRALKGYLGPDLTVAGSVNNKEAFWVSITVDDKPFWLTVARERFDRITTLEWIGWSVIAVAVSLLGAGLITSVMVRPIRQLTEAASNLRDGQKPAPVPEAGPKEIELLNRTFNQMVKDLQEADEQRALILAGISHDLRTPLARLRLEIELSGSDEKAREMMAADIEEMDRIVGQFLEFARPSPERQYSTVVLGQWVRDMLSRYTHIDPAHEHTIELTTVVNPAEQIVQLPVSDLGRAIVNLIENARRYGVKPGEDKARVSFEAQLSDTPRPGLYILIRDHGPGVPDAMLEKIRQPFTRLDNSRGTAGGSGLGLSIVDRLVARYEGRLSLSNHPDGGLVAEIFIPQLPAPNSNTLA